MPEGTPEVTEEGRNVLLRHPFLCGGAAIVLVFAAILVFVKPAPSAAWPPLLYLSETDAAASRWNLHADPGGPTVPLDWSSMTTSTSVTDGGLTAFEVSLDLYFPAKDPVPKFLVKVRPWREPTRTYATKGEFVERDGSRWYVLRPE